MVKINKIVNRTRNTVASPQDNRRTGVQNSSGRLVQPLIGNNGLHRLFSRKGAEPGGNEEGRGRSPQILYFLKSSAN